MSSILESREVLVLNKGWKAIDIITLKDAISLVSSTYDDGTPKARIIDPHDFQQFTWEDWSEFLLKEGEEGIQGVTKKHRIPEIVVLCKYEKFPDKKSKFNRKTLFKRDNFQCQYCGSKPGSEELTLEHIIPRSRGGKTTWENIVCACVDCNSKKANLTPEEAGMKLRSKPIKPAALQLYPSKKCNSWKNFLSEMYWTVPLENDM